MRLTSQGWALPRLVVPTWGRLHGAVLLFGLLRCGLSAGVHHPFFLFVQLGLCRDRRRRLPDSPLLGALHYILAVVARRVRAPLIGGGLCRIALLCRPLLCRPVLFSPAALGFLPLAGFLTLGLGFRRRVVGRRVMR